MSFFESLDKIRQKPERERKKILVLIVFILMAAIVTLWVNTLSFQERPARAAGDPKPWEVLKKIFKYK